MLLSEVGGGKRIGGPLFEREDGTAVKSGLLEKEEEGQIAGKNYGRSLSHRCMKKI